MRMPVVRSYNNRMLLKNQHSRFKLRMHCSNRDCYQLIWVEGKIEQEVEVQCWKCRTKRIVVLPRKI